MADRTPAATLRAVERRDGSRRCVMTGAETDRVVPQHRQGGMGGRPDKHRSVNVLWLDSLLNGLIEADAHWQQLSKAWGVKVPFWVTDVTAVPVFFRFERAWFVLDGDTRRPITRAEAIDMMVAVYGAEYLEWDAVADDSVRAIDGWRP